MELLPDGARGKGLCGTSSHPDSTQFGHQSRLKLRFLVSVDPLGDLRLAENSSSVSAMVSTDPFCTGRTSLHLVKWPDSTSMLVFPFGVGESGPTRSMESTCQGRPACIPCLFLFGKGLLCLAAWQASHVFTNLLISAVMLGQNQSAHTLFVVLSMPVCPCL